MILSILRQKGSFMECFETSVIPNAQVSKILWVSKKYEEKDGKERLTPCRSVKHIWYKILTNVDFFRLNKPHSYLEKVTTLNRRFWRRDIFYHDLSYRKIFVENIHNNLKIPFIIPTLTGCTISNHVSTFVRERGTSNMVFIWISIIEMVMFCAWDPLFLLVLPN